MSDHSPRAPTLLALPTLPAPSFPETNGNGVKKSKIPGFFSDLLFQPHHCATTDIKPEWVRRSTVDRRAGLTPGEFRRLYEEPNRPVVLTDAAAR